MLDRATPILKLACLLLAVLLVFRFVQVAHRVNPLARAAIPELPSLPPDTNNPATNPHPGQPAAGAATPANTNGLTRIHGQGSPTNATNVVSANRTNDAVVKPPISLATNLAAEVPAATNAPIQIPPVTKIETNNPSAANSTGLLSAAASGPGFTTTSSNAPALTSPATNLLASEATNHDARFVAPGTNASIAKSAAKPIAGQSGMPPGMPPGIMMGAMTGRRGAPLPELAPEIKARVNRIYDSEIFGQIMHPLPIGLLGIAGDVAFLRSASGQTGLVKAGDSLGDLKLLRIGTNRVLVEEQGQPKELTIFEGYGGESLISEKGKTNGSTLK